MYQKIHRWIDEDSEDVEPETPPRDPQDREEPELEELPGEKRRVPEIPEE